MTDVTFYELTEEQIERYVASGEPMDKAGAYGIQGTGGRMLVHDISGDFYNVVGLPIARVARAHSKTLVIASGAGYPPAPTILPYRTDPDRA